MARPRTILGYEPDADFFRLAAAYGYGLTRNHPFVDGNKRMAWIATFVFLRMNGWYLDAAEHEAAEVMVALANGALDEQGFADWLKDQAIAS